MQHIRLILWVAIVACTLTSFSACSRFFKKSKMLDVYASSSFSPDNLIDDGMGIGGVTSNDRERHDEETSMENLAALLRTRMYEERGGLTINSAETVSRNIGEDAYAQMMKEYETSGEISSDALTLMRESSMSVRYVIFARIEVDVVTTGSEEKTDGELNKTGDVFETKREIAIGFRIYDLTSGELAWRSLMSKTEESSVFYLISQQPEEKDDGGFAGWLVDTLLGSDKDKDKKAQSRSYPAPPKLDGQVGKIFADFADYVLRSDN